MTHSFCRLCTFVNQNRRYFFLQRAKIILILSELKLEIWCPRLTRSVIHSILFKLSCRNQLAYNELWPMTFDLRTLNLNLTCILVSSNYTSKIFKIRPTFLKLLCGNQFEYIMSCGLRIRTWPVFWCHLPIHIENIKNPSIIFEVIVRKPIWIYNELWPLTFNLRTPNSNLTCISVSSTYTSKIFKIRPSFLKLLCGNQFEYIMSCDLWPLTCGLRIRTWPVFQCHLPTHQKYSKSDQHFWSYCAETNLNI